VSAPTVLVTDLRPGRKVDLQGDPFADVDGEHRSFEFEFEVVCDTEQETPDCLRVDFESGFSCGFPTAHRVKVDPDQAPDLWAAP